MGKITRPKAAGATFLDTDGLYGESIVDTVDAPWHAEMASASLIKVKPVDVTVRSGRPGNDVMDAYSKLAHCWMAVAICSNGPAQAPDDRTDPGFGAARAVVTTVVGQCTV